MIFKNLLKAIKKVLASRHLYYLLVDTPTKWYFAV